MWAQFEGEYLGIGRYRLDSYEMRTTSDSAEITAQVIADGEHHTVVGRGNGPVSAFVNGLREHLGVDVDVLDYSEHAIGRSEEHPSELQSLMRLSYAVFCLKKKKQSRTK